MSNAIKSIGASMRKTAIQIHRKSVGYALLGVTAATLFVPAAKAALIISISDVTDGGFASSPSGGFLAGGSFGPVATPDLIYSAITASSNSPGTAGGGEVTLDHVQLTNKSGITQLILITVADDDYSAPGAPGSTLSLYGSFAGTAKSGLAGPTTGSASMSSYADPLDGPDASSSPVATTTKTSTLAPTPFATIPGSFDGFTQIAAFTRSSLGSGLYSLAGVSTVSLDAGGILNLDNNTVTFANIVVPEPTSLGILAAGGWLLMRRRRSGM